MKLGLPITPEQIKEMEQHIEDIDYDCVKAHEQEFRHDVMAHVYAYGKAAPKLLPFRSRAEAAPGLCLY